MVFGLFNKKKPDKVAIASDTAALVLKMNLAVGGIDITQWEFDGYALGYIFGFQDGIFQGLQVEDEQQSRKAMLLGLMKLFDSESVGGTLFNRCIELQTDSRFHEGMTFGGEQAFEYLGRKKNPMGLSKYLLATYATQGHHT